MDGLPKDYFVIWSYIQKRLDVMLPLRVYCICILSFKLNTRSIHLLSEVVSSFYVSFVAVLLVTNFVAVRN